MRSHEQLVSLVFFKFRRWYEGLQAALSQRGMGESRLLVVEPGSSGRRERNNTYTGNVLRSADQNEKNINLAIPHDLLLPFKIYKKVFLIVSKKYSSRVKCPFHTKMMQSFLPSSFLFPCIYLTI